MCMRCELTSVLASAVRADALSPSRMSSQCGFSAYFAWRMRKRVKLVIIAVLAFPPVEKSNRERVKSTGDIVFNFIINRII